MKSPIFCAIDVADLDQALALAKKVSPHVGGLKLGLEFFTANGPQGVREMKKLGLPIFLDLKLHDIPNTVAGAVRAAAKLEVQYLTLHVSGGRAMIIAAIKAARDTHTALKLLGVTVLTSLDDADLEEIGQRGPTLEQVERLAELALDAELDGLVCSAAELEPLRQELGPDFPLVVPGIRPADAGASDQKRTMTPKEAMKAGATFIVVGRPITQNADPHEAAKLIAGSLKHGEPAHASDPAT
jgi:orotidine-5'-phosphate decarboxylase